MKYILLVILSIILLLIVYGYFRAKYIERNIDFSITVSKLDFKESKILEAFSTGEIKFGSTFLLNIDNRSNFSTKLRKLRIILKTDSGNLSIISKEIKSVYIPKYESTSVKLPSDVIIKSSALGEAIALAKGGKISINYKVFGKIMIFPLFYEGTLEL